MEVRRERAEPEQIATRRGGRAQECLETHNWKRDALGQTDAHPADQALQPQAAIRLYSGVSRVQGRAAVRGREELEPGPATRAQPAVGEAN
jgi:hypothetical protein